MPTDHTAATIWVDADALPVAIRDILYRAASRRKVAVVLVANQALQVPRNPYLRAITVGAGFDVADDYIVEHACAGDLVITADIPLAADVIAKHATALSPRGEAFTANNIRQRLNMRDFMDTLRGSGIDTGGQSAMSQTDRRNFANQLDRWLTQANRRAD